MRMIAPVIPAGLLRRTAGLVAAAALAAGLLAGCGNDDVDTDCSGLSACTITFDRGAEASTRVLGVSVELVSAGSGEATVAVGGREVTVPVEGSREAAGMTVEVLSLTAEEVVVRISR